MSWSRKNRKACDFTKTLDELRAAYEALRTEFYQVEKSSTEFAAKAEKLGEELELARESNRALESASIQLYNNLLTGSTELTDLRHTLAEERTQREAVTEARELLQEQLDGAASAPSANWKARSPPRARSWRCWTMKNARSQPPASNRSTKSPASRGG